MSKYDALWHAIAADGRETPFTLSFDALRELGGVAIDHSFLNAKKELFAFGYAVKKISLKDRTVTFEKTPENQ
ncbi:MAG: hypothetical protein Q4C53_04530 [Clostridia bacterium]|nr:hypothetical protein [Clostridia bacterium]